MQDIGIWQFVFRVVSMYVFVMIALRVMGKREIGQLSVFDFVVSVMIAELVTIPMENTSVPFYRPFLAIALLAILQISVAFIQLKSHRIRHWVDGEPSVLIEHGKLNDREMRRTRYTINDLLTQMRQNGVANVADVEFAILETSGQLSVFPKSDKRPVTPGDIGQKVDAEIVPMPIIIDGRAVKKTMSILKVDESWLAAEVERRGYGKVKDVFYAAVDNVGNLFLTPKNAKSKD